MFLLRSCLPAFACTVLLTQCTSRQEKTAGIGALLHLQPRYAVQAIKHPTSYIGEWSYSFPFYSSSLLIKEDGTFTYHDRGCTGSSYSEGTWTQIGLDIVITSYQQYAPDKQVELIEIDSEPDVPVEPEPAPNEKEELKGDSMKFFIDTALLYPTGIITLDDIKSNSTDPYHVYFDKVVFRLMGDTLYELKKNGQGISAEYVQLDDNSQ